MQQLTNGVRDRRREGAMVGTWPLRSTRCVLLVVHYNLGIGTGAATPHQPSRIRRPLEYSKTRSSWRATSASQSRTHDHILSDNLSYTNIIIVYIIYLPVYRSLLGSLLIDLVRSTVVLRYGFHLFFTTCLIIIITGTAWKYIFRRYGWQTSDEN